MKALKSKTPYLILLATLFCIAATDSFLWSQKVDPLVVDVDRIEETRSSTPNSYIKIALINENE